MDDDAPDVIYLAPLCQTDKYEGRLWCQDDVWSGSQSSCDIDGCRHEPVKYVRAYAKVMGDDALRAHTEQGGVNGHWMEMRRVR